MDDILGNLTDPSWWMSVVIGSLIIGILGSVASTYLVRALDVRMARASTWWRNRSAARRAKWQAEVQKLRDHPAERYHQEFVTLRMYAQSTQLIILCVLGALLSVIESLSIGLRSLCIVIAVLTGLLSFARARMAVSLAAQIREARAEANTPDDAGDDASN